MIFKMPHSVFVSMCERETERELSEVMQWGRNICNKKMELYLVL